MDTIKPFEDGLFFMKNIPKVELIPKSNIFFEDLDRFGQISGGIPGVINDRGEGQDGRTTWFQT